MNAFERALVLDPRPLTEPVALIRCTLAPPCGHVGCWYCRKWARGENDRRRFRRPRLRPVQLRW